MQVFSESDMEKQKSDSEFWSGMFAVIGISAATAMFLQVSKDDYINSLPELWKL